MATPFIAQILISAFNFAPRGYALCDGQLLPIGQNQALFSLVGTIYGGDGRTNFALPDFRGRAPMHWNANYSQGQKSGEETHVLLSTEMPAHNHGGTPAGGASCSSAVGTSNSPGGRVPAVTARPVYADAPNTALGGALSAATGGGQAHENRQPFLVMNFCIALTGTFPSRN